MGLLQSCLKFEDTRLGPMFEESTSLGRMGVRVRARSNPRNM